MASISGPGSRYPGGHRVVLKDPNKIPTASKKAFSEYKPGKTVFSLVDSSPNFEKTIIISEQKNTILLKDDKGMVLNVVGTPNQINGTFNHFSKSSKSKTNITTELKEVASLHVFEHFLNKRSVLSENEMIALLKKAPEYTTIFYESAIRQLDAFKKIKLSGSYVFERQEDNISKAIYSKGRKLSKKANDNWNPADLWVFKKSYLKTMNKELEKIKSLAELNSWIALGLYAKNIIPISLKQVSSGQASLSINDPEKLLNKKLDLDLNIKNIQFPPTFKNFILITKSGFAPRVGFKASASTLNISVEGRFMGAGYQLGAVDATELPRWVLKNFKYKLRSGQNTKTDLDTAFKELEKIKVFPDSLSNMKKLKENILSSNDFIQQRFSHLVSYLYAYMNFDREKILTFSFFSSKKITKSASAYYLIN